MDLKKLLEAIDAQVLSGDIIGAFETYAADNCITHSTPDDVTHSKGQKSEALRWFFSNVANINKIDRPAAAVVGDNETHSQFVFDFTNNQGQPLVYHEVIRRVWNGGKLVEEQYLFGQTIAPVAKAKKAKADATTAPAAAPAAKKAAPAKKTAVKEAAAPAKAAVKETPATAKAAAPKKETAPKATKAPVATPVPKADDLTIIEGVGPKIAELLVAAGIVTFVDLAKAKPAAIKKVLDAAGKKFQMHDPATWPKQAGLARDGKTAELAKLQAELKGGK